MVDDIKTALEQGASLDDMPSETLIKAIEYQQMVDEQIEIQIDDAIERQHHTHGR